MAESRKIRQRALAFAKKVANTLVGDQARYDTLMDMVAGYCSGDGEDSGELKRKVAELFADHPGIVAGFQAYSSPGNGFAASTSSVKAPNRSKNLKQMKITMGDMESWGPISRIKKCAYELLVSIEEALVYHDDEGSWGLLEMELRLRPTFLFCDLNSLISSSKDDHFKQNLTMLGNKLFSHIEELEKAAKSRSFGKTRSQYFDAADALDEVMAALVPAPPAH